MANKSIHLMGAGLVGSLWAYLLKKKGFDVHVYEKRADPRGTQADRGRSINLVITSRGRHALKQAGLDEAILPITVPVFGRRIHAIDGRTQYQAYGRDDSECNYAVSRWELNTTLIKAAAHAGVTFYFEHELSDLDLAARTVRFSNGNTANYRVLFATDGAGSAIRKKMQAIQPRLYQEDVRFISSDYKELYVPARADGQPAIEKNNLHIWPRGTHMLMALANQDNSFTLTLYLPRSDHPWSFDSIQTPARVQELFQSEFPDARALVPDLSTQFLEHPQGRLGTVRFTQWHYQDSVALMGDAAHAIVPFFGQGMNCGFEDITTLLTILDENQWDFKSGLEAYSRLRIPNAQAIADMALENFVEMSDKVGDQTFLLQKKIESVLEKEFPQLYRSRYGMITYTLIPYSLAQEAGRIQNRLLTTLSQTITRIEDLNLAHCQRAMEQEWLPWLKAKGICLDRYR
ncbi:MAG: FAD-dependent monooxygenase [Bdellovibrionaceae bacterium]|nr:FAD-dependent monooxygenase [Pseudobdellovibrionaceae bacterium]